MEETTRLRARSCLVLIVLVLVAACVLYTVLRTVEYVVWGERASWREFDIESTFMDASLFPPGWWDRGVTTRPLTKWVYRDGGHAFQEIYWQLHFKQAKQLYQRYLESKFARSEHYQEEWQPRPDLCQQLTFADECYAACAFYSIEWREYYQFVEEDKQKCQVLARYQGFLILFYAPGAPYLTFEDLANVLRGIDQRFAAAMELEGAPDKTPEEERP